MTVKVIVTDMDGTFLNDAKSTITHDLWRSTTS